MRSLRWQLGGALLLMVVVSVGLMAYLTNLSTTREFRQYLSHGDMMYAGAVADGLERFYAQRGAGAMSRKYLAASCVQALTAWWWSMVRG